MSDIPGLDEALTRQFQRRAAAVAQTLRDTATQIERQATRIDSNPADGRPDFGSTAASIVHTFMWGMANASPDGVVRAAAEADGIGVDHAKES